MGSACATLIYNIIVYDPNHYENTLLLPSFPIDASFIDNLCPCHPDIISIHPFLRKFPD